MLARPESTCPCCRQAWPEGRPTVEEVIAGLKLSNHQRIILEKLAKRFGQWVSTEEIVDAVYADDPDGGPVSADKSIGVRLWQVRGRLARAGLKVEGMKGAGSAGRRLVWS